MCRGKHTTIRILLQDVPTYNHRRSQDDLLLDMKKLYIVNGKIWGLLTFILKSRAGHGGQGKSTQLKLCRHWSIVPSQHISQPITLNWQQGTQSCFSALTSQCRSLNEETTLPVLRYLTCPDVVFMPGYLSQECCPRNESFVFFSWPFWICKYFKYIKTERFKGHRPVKVFWSELSMQV